MEIRIDDLRGPEISALLTEHLQCMAEVSPPGSCHALNLDRLRQPGITFWSAWERSELLGCGALRELDPRHGEIKSMRTAKAHLRKGVATKMLEHIISEARRRGYRQVSLETGAVPYFEPARQLYRKFGFRICPPFGNYIEDANSVFMSLEEPSMLMCERSIAEMNSTPETIVQRQLDAYNARDIEALMLTYADDAKQFAYPSKLLASGAGQIRERFVARFQEPNLHARLMRRIAVGEVVIDHEEITRTFPEGTGTIELVAIYELRNGRIATARFISGPKTLDSKS